MSDYERAMREMFDSRVLETAQALERLSTEVAHMAARGDDPDVIGLATAVQHKVLWAMVNLNLDNLTRAAGRVLEAHDAQARQDAEDRERVSVSEPDDPGWAPR